MVSHHFVYQLVLFALIWLFIILHLIRPKRPMAAPATPTEEPEPLKPKRQRSNEPKLSMASPKSLIVSCMNETLSILNCRLRCHPTPCPRRTGVPIKSTPHSTSVRMPVVITRVGSGLAIYGPTVILVAALRSKKIEAPYKLPNYQLYLSYLVDMFVRVVRLMTPA